MTRRVSKEEIQERGLETDVILRRTDASEPLPVASVEATKRVVHAYVAPPVLDLQGQLRVPGRKPLPSEIESYRTNEIESQTAMVDMLKVEIKRDTHEGYSDHVTTAEDNARAIAASVAKITADMQREKQAPYALVVAREAKAHQENVDMIRAEMIDTITTEEFSGGNGGN